MINELPENARRFLLSNTIYLLPDEKYPYAFYKERRFRFYIEVLNKTKNSVLHVCSKNNEILGTASGDKHIGDVMHAEEFAAPKLVLQLQAVDIKKRRGATLYNVCQSPTCQRSNTNPSKGCLGILQNIRNQYLTKGNVVDSTTKYPFDLRDRSDIALAEEITKQLPKE